MGETSVPLKVVVMVTADDLFEASREINSECDVTLVAEDGTAVILRLAGDDERKSCL